MAARKAAREAKWRAISEVGHGSDYAKEDGSDS